MRPWRSSLILFALVAAGLAQTGETLRCMCGSSYTTRGHSGLIARLYRRSPAVAAGGAPSGPVDSEELKRYREQIEEDFSKLN